MSRFGPGLIVTAAFIGPGTITTATVAGANFGFTLIWALLFSVATTLILQEMSARLGIVARTGLAEALRESITMPVLKWSVLVLIVIAIGFGNAAYQTGNLLGAAVGAGTLTGLSQTWLVLVIAVVATSLLAGGVYRLVEMVLVVLVFLMSMVFILAMLMNPPDPVSLVLGFLPTTFPDTATLTIIAIIGTTVVPYNLFLHASAVQQKWSPGEDPHLSLREARTDLGVSIGIGGLITLAIISTSATAFYGKNIEVTGATIALQLEPLLGAWAKYLVACGLLSAGLTSAITAPLAAAYAVCGALGFATDLKGAEFRTVWVVVMLFGAGFAIAESAPITAILIAQSANGLILPVVAVALVWVMNQKSLGAFRNGAVTNLLGALVVAITFGLGLNKLVTLAL